VKRAPPTCGGYPAAAAVDKRASFAFIRYASVWEDAEILCAALAPVAGGGRLLSIASAGDNALALLTLDRAEVIAVALAAAQLDCLELRMAAFRRLDDPALLAFLGLTASSSRLETYRRLRTDLTVSARAFWEAHPQAIARGVIHAGKFERYLRAFRRFILPLVHSQGTIAQLRKPRSLEEQVEFYDRRWDTWRWRSLFRVFFSRRVMGRMGRDPAFFAHVEGSAGARLLARTRHALTALPAHSNPYLAYIMTGTYPPEALPRYLCPAHTGTIRDRLDRVRFVHGSLPSAGEGRFDGFNLSDIFEYMSPAEHERCYGALIDRANPGARLVYWNMLAPRCCPAAESSRVSPLADVAARLHAQDRAWFYQALRVDEVKGEAVL